MRALCLAGKANYARLSPVSSCLPGVPDMHVVLQADVTRTCRGLVYNAVNLSAFLP